MRKPKPKKPKIEDKQKELNYLLVNDRDNPKVEVLKKELNFINYGIR